MTTKAATNRRSSLRTVIPPLGSGVAGIALLLYALVTAAGPLRDHPSAYLSLHADDPVQWRLLDQAALDEARRENKPIFLSSGYFACHWCHVMQRESFRAADIAALLNRHFIPVKIDRELSPQEDAYLIAFVQRSRGIAGWPLSVFLTPEGHPLYGTAYIPPAELRALLRNMAELWRREGADWRQVAAAEALGGAGAVSGAAVPNAVLREALWHAAMASADELEGGFGGPAKFPHVPRLRALLRLYGDGGDAALGDFLRLTLQQMATQGLRDHIGGGFFRYTVDPSWQEPHFEKMLYDSAQLAVLYFEAAHWLGEEHWAAVARDTLDFLLREMLLADGAFAASLSALDAAGVEGGSYLWTEAALRRALTAREYDVASAAWGLQGAAVFSSGLLPRQMFGTAALRQRLGADAAEVLAIARSKLLRARSVRMAPRDDKRIAAWNGLVLQALSLGVQQGGEARYRAAARRLRDYLVTRLWDGRRLARAADQSGALPGEGVLEDYAQVAAGLVAWGHAGAAPDDRRLALHIVEAGWQRYRRDDVWSSGSVLPLGQAQRVLADGVMISPAALLAQVAACEGDASWELRARAALEADTALLYAAPLDYAGYIVRMCSRR